MRVLHRRVRKHPRTAHAIPAKRSTLLQRDCYLKLSCASSLTKEQECADHKKWRPALSRAVANVANLNKSGASSHHLQVELRKCSTGSMQRQWDLPIEADSEAKGLFKQGHIEIENVHPTPDAHKLEA